MIFRFLFMNEIKKNFIFKLLSPNKFLIKEYWWGLMIYCLQGLEIHHHPPYSLQLDQKA